MGCEDESRTGPTNLKLPASCLVREETVGLTVQSPGTGRVSPWGSALGIYGTCHGAVREACGGNLAVDLVGPRGEGCGGCEGTAATASN